MSAASEYQRCEIQRGSGAEMQTETALNPHLRKAVTPAATPSAERRQSNIGQSDVVRQSCYERLAGTGHAELKTQESRMPPVCERTS